MQQEMVYLLHLISHLVRVSCNHVNFVEDRYNGQVLLKGQEEICNCLRLHDTYRPDIEQTTASFTDHTGKISCTLATVNIVRIVDMQ